MDVQKGPAEVGVPGRARVVKLTLSLSLSLYFPLFHLYTQYLVLLFLYTRTRNPSPRFGPLIPVRNIPRKVLFTQAAGIHPPGTSELRRLSPGLSVRAAGGGARTLRA